MKTLIAMAAVMIACHAPARAQRFSGQAFPPSFRQAGSDADGTSITVNLNLNMGVGTLASPEDRAAALEKAQHVMLNVFARECDLLHSELKMECRISQMNLNAGMNANNGAPESYINAGVQGTMVMTPSKSP